MGIALLMLMSCPARVFAEENVDGRQNKMFTPDIFIAALNEEIAFIVNAMYPSASEEQREELISYLQLRYAESSETAIWYDNQDWIVELSAYFRDGNVDPAGCADTLTLSFPVGDEYALIYNTVGVSVSALLSLLEEDIDFVRFSTCIDQCYYSFLETGKEAYAPFEFDGYSIGVLLYTQYNMNRMAIALLKEKA